MLSLLRMTMATFLHEYTYRLCGVRSIKTNGQRVRQQDMFATWDDVTQFRHREVRLG